MVLAQSFGKGLYGWFRVKQLLSYVAGSGTRGLGQLGAGQLLFLFASSQGISMWTLHLGQFGLPHNMAALGY